MKKININVEKVGNVIKTAGGLVLYAAVIMLPYVSTKDVVNKIRYSGNVKYSDAINAILNSGMYSSDKSKLTSMLPKDSDADLYRAVIQVANSDMFSSDKVKMIKDICGENSEKEETH